MSGKRSRARKPRARRAGRAQQAPGQQAPEAQPPPPDAGGPLDETGVALAGHVTGSQPAARGHPKVARPERPQAAERQVPAVALGSELVPVPAADMEDGRPGGRTHSLGAELLRLHEVQLCLAQEQQLLADRRRQVQLQMQLWQEEQLWREQLWREEQLWLQQLQEEQAWVRMEGLELAVALEQLQSEGLEVLQTHGQVRPGGHAGGGGTDGLGGGAALRVLATHRHLQTRAHMCKVRLMPTAGWVGMPGQGACSGKLRQRCSCRGQVLSRAGLRGEGDSPGGEPAGHRPQRTCPPVYCMRVPGSIAEAVGAPSPASSFQDRGRLPPTHGGYLGNQGPTPAWPEEQAPPSSQVLGPRSPLQAEGVPPRSRASPLLVSTAPSGLGWGDLEQPPGRGGQLSQSSGLGRGQAVAVERAAAEQQQVEQGVRVDHRLRL